MSVVCRESVSGSATSCQWFCHEQQRRHRRKCAGVGRAARNRSSRSRSRRHGEAREVAAERQRHLACHLMPPGASWAWSGPVRVPPDAGWHGRRRVYPCGVSVYPRPGRAADTRTDTPRVPASAPTQPAGLLVIPSPWRARSAAGAAGAVTRAARLTPGRCCPGLTAPAGSASLGSTGRRDDEKAPPTTDQLQGSGVPPSRSPARRRRCLFVVRGLSADDDLARLRVNQADADDGRGRRTRTTVERAPALRIR